MKSYLPQRVHPLQLIKPQNLDLLFQRVQVLLGFVDLLEVPVEYLDQAESHVLDLFWVTQDILEQELLLFVFENVLLSLHELVAIVLLLVEYAALSDRLEPLFVDPVEEQGLILVEVGLGHE